MTDFMKVRAGDLVPGEQNLRWWSGDDLKTST